MFAFIQLKALFKGVDIIPLVHTVVKVQIVSDVGLVSLFLYNVDAQNVLNFRNVLVINLKFDHTVEDSFFLGFEDEAIHFGNPRRVCVDQLIQKQVISTDLQLLNVISGHIFLNYPHSFERQFNDVFSCDPNSIGHDIEVSIQIH